MLPAQCDQSVHLGHAIPVLTSLQYSTQKLASLREANSIVAFLKLLNASQMLADSFNLRKTELRGSVEPLAEYVGCSQMSKAVFDDMLCLHVCCLDLSECRFAS